MADAEKPLTTEEYEEGCCAKFATTTGLCCFMSENEYKHNPLTEVVQNDHRRCTDLPCCIILALCLISELVLIIYADSKGASPSLLMHGYDARNGRLCNYAGGSYAVWPSLDATYTDIRICAPDCSYTDDARNLYIEGQNGGSMQEIYASTAFMNAYCLPSAGDLVPSSFDSSTESYQRAVSDLQTAAWLIFIMSFVGILISCVYLKLIACIGRLLIMFTIIVVTVGGVMLCWLLIQDGSANMESDETKTIGEVELGVGITLSVLLVFFILALWFMRKNIELVIEMLNEASHAIRDMKWTIVFPVWISLVVMAFVCVWIVEALYIYSVKTQTRVPWPDIAFFTSNSFYDADSQYFKLEFDDQMQDSLIWHFVMLFYISQVIIYFGYMVLSGVFADWYFSLWSDKNNKIKRRGNGPAELSRAPITESLWRVARYHLGSLAFGAMIVTIIRVIRAVVTYIQKKVLAKEGNNPLLKCLFCCIQCCLKCCQSIFDKINKEGFVVTTIYGTPYCYSSFTALKILVHNVGRTVMVEGVSKYTEVFGRFAIAALNTGLAVLIMKYQTYYKNNLSSYLFPALVIFVMSYMIAALFMMVFEVAVDAIFLCFLIDEEVHGEAKFANHGLSEMARFAEKSNEEENADNKSYGSTVKKTGDEHMDYTAV
mmetsp:Transcript_6580/g.10782  ORF Transcript_6580/g.10782 Transcript_6580/m.10782 type:complete len:657 (+) Transcript_6580:98-2068(+)